MTEGERIKYLRSVLSDGREKMTLERFGEKLGVGKTAISKIENNERALTDQMAKSISREFNVREEWLRAGKGEMFRQQSRNEQIEAFVNAIQLEDDHSFKKRFISALSSLSDTDWEVLARIAQNMLREQASADPADAASGELSIDERVEDYRRQLELEESTRERSSASSEELKKA